MRAVLQPVALTLALLAVCACSDRRGAQAPPTAGDAAAATVDGRSIWVSDVKAEAVAEGLIGREDPLDVHSDIFKRALEEVIDQRLLADEAVRRHLDRDPVVERRLAAARDRALGGALTDQVVQAALKPDQVKELYDQVSTAATSADEVKLSQIITRTGLEAAAAKNAIQKGGESFESLALQRSLDAATKSKGGDLGGYISLDALPPAYADAVRNAQIGQIVGPFETAAGFVVLKVQDRRNEGPVSLQAAKPLLVRFLTYDQVKDLVENLRGKAKVQILPAGGAAPASAPPPTSAPAPGAPAAAPPAPAAPPAKAPINPTPSSVKPGASSLPKAAAR